MTDNSILLESPMKYIEWKINNFFDQPTEVGYCIESTCFSLLDAKWFIEIYTKGRTYYSCGYIDLYLKMKESVTEHCVDYTIGIKRPDGYEKETKRVNAQTFSSTVNTDDYSYGSQFIKRSQLLSMKDTVAPDGTLTVFCSLRITNTPLVSPILESVSESLSAGISSLVEDLKELYVSSRHADVTVRVKGGKEFRAHRSILSSRSSVFGSMFLHDMEEKNSGFIEIPDCDPDTFENFLLFLYTGKFDFVLSDSALGLHRIADKYNVKVLKDECVRCMINKLSDDIFCDVFHFATMQNDQDLLKGATDYFIKNAKTIAITTKWHTFLSEHPLLGNELFCKLLNEK